MTTKAVLDELRARFELLAGAPSFMLGVVSSDAVVDQVHALVLGILRASPLTLQDLGRCTSQKGPAKWVEATRAHADVDGYVLSFTPATQLESRAFAHLLNAERQHLEGLAGPLLLIVSRQTEAEIRTSAHDFFTWARSYVLPDPRALEHVAREGGAVLPSAPEEAPVRFLHLSDLHMRPDPVRRYDQDRVLRGLLEFLERDRQTAPLDLVFVTGDLAFSGKPEELALVAEFLRTLMQVTGVPPERMFVVPGNHDVDRRVGRWLVRTLKSDQESMEFFTEPGSRDLHRRKLEAYETALRPVLGDDRPLGLCVGRDAVEIVEVRGARIGVASLNSSWFSQGDSDRGQLWLGDSNVSQALDRIADEDSAFAIALLHHPLEYFHELERSLLERRVERGFDLVLRGHLHTDKTLSIAGPRGGYVEVAAPAAYQGSQWPNGCFLGEIRVAARTIRLRPYKLTGGPDPWVLDAAVFPDDDGDGYCRTFSVPSKRRRKSGMAAAARLAVQDAFESVTPQRQRAIQRNVLANDAGLDDRAVHEAKMVLMEEPEVALHDVLGKGTPALELVGAISRRGSSGPRTTIDIGTAEGFERALVAAGRVFLEEATRLGARPRLSHRAAILGLVAALGLFVDEPIRVEAQVGSHEVDIFVGGPDVQSASVIEVKKKPSTASGIQRELVRLAKLAPAAQHVALVLVGSVPVEQTEPMVGRRTLPPSGQELHVLHV